MPKKIEGFIHLEFLLWDLLIFYYHYWSLKECFYIPIFIGILANFQGHQKHSDDQVHDSYQANIHNRACERFKRAFP